MINSQFTTTWHLLTGEYPAQPGGVSDYTHLLARGLAEAGDDVHVWTPAYSGPAPCDRGVSVHRLPDHFGLHSLRVLGAALNAEKRSARILVQYVPHAFGWKAMNVPFCHWLMHRRQPVWVMFHEVAFPRGNGKPWKHRLLGWVNEKMAGWIGRSAQRVFVTIPSWGETIQRLTGTNRTAVWLPVPSTLATEVTPGAASKRRLQLGVLGESPLVGHFGTFGGPVAPMLEQVLPDLLKRRPACSFLLIGRNSGEFRRRIVDNVPSLADRLIATGNLPADEAAECIAACDVMLQPYPDGVSCRRTSTMASLALGRPVVTTSGALTESIWSESAAVRLAPPGDDGGLIQQVECLLDDDAQRRLLGNAGLALYRSRFALDRTIATLRECAISRNDIVDSDAECGRK